MYGDLVHIIGGKNQYNNVCKLHRTFNISDAFSIDKGFPMFSWKCERILWIAYLKNVKNKHCNFGQIPKDILKLIVSFC